MDPNLRMADMAEMLAENGIKAAKALTLSPNLGDREAREAREAESQTNTPHDQQNKHKTLTIISTKQHNAAMLKS